MFLADELGDFGAELKLSFFQLGISPQIVASILMQVYSFFFIHLTYTCMIMKNLHFMLLVPKVNIIVLYNFLVTKEMHN